MSDPLGGLASVVDVAVIGAGPAGMAAACAAHDAGASVLVLERDAAPGGILRQCIHNGFGLHYFKEELTGPEYAARFAAMVRARGVDVLTGAMVLSVRPSEAPPARWRVSASHPDGMVLVEAKAVVLAMGCRERTRGALGIPGTRPAGVYTAGAAQRLMNLDGFLPGKKAVILGSGDIGLIMARRLTWEGASVVEVAELMPYSGGLTRNIVQCLEDNGIPLRFNTTVVEVHGRERVEGVTLAGVDPATRREVPGTRRFVACDTLLLSVGLLPENEVSRAAGVAMDGVTGGALVDQRRMTSRPGIFACGNVLHVHDLVDFVSREAETAGAAAARYAQGCDSMDTLDSNDSIPVKPSGAVRYVVPQRLDGTCLDKETELFFRVGDVVRDVTLTVESVGQTRQILLSRKKAVMKPGEMERVVFDASKASGEVVVSVVQNS